jgi:hypothetical protein
MSQDGCLWLYSALKMAVEQEDFRLHEDAVSDSSACQSYQNTTKLSRPLLYTSVSLPPSGNLFISFQSVVFSSLLAMSPIISFAEDPLLLTSFLHFAFRDHILLLKRFPLIACLLPHPWHSLYWGRWANTAVSVKNTVFWYMKPCSW